MTPQIKAQIESVRKARKVYEDAADVLEALVRPLLTTPEACDEMLRELPEGHVRFMVFQIRKSMK